MTRIPLAWISRWSRALKAPLALVIVFPAVAGQAAGKDFPDTKKMPPISTSSGLGIMAVLKAPRTAGERRDGVGFRMVPGLLWKNGGRDVVVSSRSGFTVWGLAARGFALGAPTIMPFHRLGINEAVEKLPDAMVIQGDAVGVIFCAVSPRGAGIRLIAQWYAKKTLRFLRSYAITVDDARKTYMGVPVVAPVKVVAPRNGNWLATVARRAEPWSRVRVWRSRDGKTLAVHLPPLWQSFNAAFCDGSGSELGWVSAGHHVYFAHLQARGAEHSRVSSIRVVSAALRQGAISPDGKHLVLMASPRWDASDITTILAPRSGAGVESIEKVSTWLADSGTATAAPEFSPDNKLVACVFFCKHLSLPFGVSGAYLLIASVKGFRPLYWAKIPGATPIALSFSPDSRRLAVEVEGGQRGAVIFDIPARSPPGQSPWPPARAQRRIAIPPRPTDGRQKH